MLFGRKKKSANLNFVFMHRESGCMIGRFEPMFIDYFFKPKARHAFDLAYTLEVSARCPEPTRVQANR